MQLEYRRLQLSYCRYSSDNWNSDLYVYETFTEIVIAVAITRIVGDTPLIPLMPSPSTEADRREYCKACDKQYKFVATAERIPIGLPNDGEIFQCATAEEAVEILLELKKTGYRFPEYIIKEILEEE